MRRPDFYLLRTPALAYAHVLRMNACESRSDLVDILYDFYQLRHVQDAIFLASTVLFHQLQRWLQDENNRSNNDKLLATLYKYAVRMCSRSTPFGMFSGVSLGKIDEGSSALISNCRHHVLKKISGTAAADVAVGLNSISELKSKRIIKTNTTLYSFNGGYRYYEYYLKEGRRHYFLSFVEDSPYLSYVLSKAENGIVYSDLVAGLTKMDIPVSVAEDYIDQIFGEQLLTSDLELTVTAGSYFKKVSEKLIDSKFDNDWYHRIEGWDNLLKSSTSVIDTNNSLSADIGESLKTSTDRNMIQADMRVGMHVNQINSAIIETIISELESLSLVFEPPVPEEMNAFKKKFFERYEYGEVPLLEALDSDIGIGYGDSSEAFMSSDFNFEEIARLSEYKESRVAEIRVKQMILDLYTQYLDNDQCEIILTDDILKNYIAKDKTKPQSSYYFLGNLLATDAAAMDRGKFNFILKACSGPSVLSLMARFCDVVPNLENKLKECLSYEEQAIDEVIASIAHLPEVAVAGVVQRPSLRRYEIPLLNSSDVSPEYQICLGDLYVSIVDDQVILRSKKLNKRIIPRLDSAHNYRRGIGLYRFLGDLQYQGQNMYVNWNWGELERQIFLPRIRYKHIVLSRARWLIRKDMINRWGEMNEEVIKARFMDEYKLPSQVMLVSGDNELLIDFNSLLGFNILYNELKKKDVILMEPAFTGDQHVVRDCFGQPYANEILVPVNKRIKQLPQSLLHSFKPRRLIRRTFSPGSEWVYLKVYCGFQTADRILKQELPTIINELSKKRTIKQWFFIRYSDSDYHLRIRFNLTAASSNELSHLFEVVHLYLDPLLRNRYISKLQYDSYHREIERYGHDCMELSECLFHIDSEFVIQMLTEDHNKVVDRLLTAIYGINQLFDYFKLDDAEKLSFVKSMRDYFLEEYKETDKLRYEFDKSFRVYRDKIDKLFSSDGSASQLIPLSQFRHRGQGLLPIAEQLKATVEWSADRILNLLQSYCHMFQNRLYLTKPRLQEALAYHFLLKHYQGVLRRFQTRSIFNDTR